MASRSLMLVPILKEVLLREIGEANLEPLKWEQASPYTYTFKVNIDDEDRKVNVSFQQIVDKAGRHYYFPPVYRHLTNVFNVAYDVEGTEVQFRKTTLKTLLTVLSTVVDIVKHFLNTVECEGLYVMGTEKTAGTGDISKKYTLYKAFIVKQIKDVGGFGIDSHRDGFIVVKAPKK